MSKMKTKSAAKKRFKLSGGGLIKRKQMNTRHILTKKSPKRKRRLRGLTYVDDSNVSAVKDMLAKN